MEISQQQPSLEVCASSTTPSAICTGHVLLPPFILVASSGVEAIVAVTPNVLILRSLKSLVLEAIHGACAGRRSSNSHFHSGEGDVLRRLS